MKTAGALVAAHAQPQTAPSNGTVLPLTSTTDVLLPTPGRAFMKFSFDFPEPSVVYEGFRFAFRVFTFENVYTPDRSKLSVESRDGSLTVSAAGLEWAGGQEKAPGGITAAFRKTGPHVECRVEARMNQPVKAASIIVRDIPRGRLSGGGTSFSDPRNDEVLFGYPFGAGDLFGPNSARGIPTPLVMIERGDGNFLALSCLDDRVRATRFYFQPGEKQYRTEVVCEAEGWQKSNEIKSPALRLTRGASVEEVARPHLEHIERAYRLPAWETRADAPAWLRRTALVATLHGMHYSGYIFNDFAKMGRILDWMAGEIPPERVLVFLSAWDGRYYWDYPLYRPAPRLGGETGFQALIEQGRRRGFRLMPMFGANAANRNQPVYARIADAATARVDGEAFDLDWVDWDNDRHQDGWLSYMNLGVDSWRRWLAERIAETIERYRVDAYFLDIVGGWMNNPRADMHEGARRLVEELRRKYPQVAAIGEMHYDALLAFIPFYHVFSQQAYPPLFEKFARSFYHLSHPAPGRGSSGVHEFGFGRWNPQTLSLANDARIPTLNVVDDTFEKYRDQMQAVIGEAKRRAGI